MSAELSSLYWTAITVIRLVFVALLSKVNGRITVHFLTATCFMSSLYIMLRSSDLSLLELKLCLIMVAFGTGPQFAINMVLFQEFSPIDASVSGLFLMGHSLGIKTFSPAIGFFVEENPSIIFLFPTVTSSACMVIYIVLEVLRAHIKNAVETKQTG